MVLNMQTARIAKQNLHAIVISLGTADRGRPHLEDRKITQDRSHRTAVRPRGGPGCGVACSALLPMLSFER